MHMKRLWMNIPGGNGGMRSSRQSTDRKEKDGELLTSITQRFGATQSGSGRLRD